MAVRKILLLGNPDLYRISQDIEFDEIKGIEEVVKDLHDTLMEYRRTYGVGRAIAAPQIGIFKRLIYMHIDKPIVFINPVLEFIGDATIELWDDCMSFPNLLVKVSRNKHCRIHFRDNEWNQNEMDLSDDLSELLQHEYDHLNGILAVQRAIDGQSFSIKSELLLYNKQYKQFLR